MNKFSKIFLIVMMALFVSGCPQSPADCARIAEFTGDPPPPGNGSARCCVELKKAIRPPRICPNPPGACIQCYIPSTDSTVNGDMCIADILTVPDGASGGNKGITTWLVDEIGKTMQAASQALYVKFGGCPPSGAGSCGGTSDVGKLKGTINTAMVLAVMLFGVSVILGIIKPTAYVTFMLALKLILVYNLTTNWDIFKELVVDNFEALVNDLTLIVGNVFTSSMGSDPLSTFEMVDSTISMFLSSNYYKVLLAMAVSGLAGLAYAFIFGFMMLMYFWAVLEAVKTFLIALIARHLLYAVAPVFITFALFNQTKSLFDGWMEQLINFSLQPVFLFAFLGMFHLIIMSFVNGTVIKSDAFQVCYEPLLEIPGLGIYFSLWRLTDINSSSTVDVDLAFNMWSLLSIILLVYLMRSMIQWSVMIAGRLSGGLVSASPAPLRGWETGSSGVGRAAERAGGAAGRSLPGGGGGGGSSLVTNATAQNAARIAAPPSSVKRP